MTEYLKRIETAREWELDVIADEAASEFGTDSAEYRAIYKAAQARYWEINQ